MSQTPTAAPRAPRRRRGDYYPDTMSRKARELLRALSDHRFSASVPCLAFAAPIHADYARMVAGELIAAGC